MRFQVFFRLEGVPAIPLVGVVQSIAAVRPEVRATMSFMRRKGWIGSRS